MNSAERREARYQRRKAARMKKKAAALREYGDFETVFSFERLYESYRASVRGVGWKASTQRYKAASLANVTKTHEELIAGRYCSKGFYEFDIVERGKPRHIRSVHISERVVQRCLCDYCLVPMLSRSFILEHEIKAVEQAVKHPSASQHGIPTEIETADEHQNEKEIPTITPSQPEADSEPKAAH